MFNYAKMHHVLVHVSVHVPVTASCRKFCWVLKFAVRSVCTGCYGMVLMHRWQRPRPGRPPTLLQYEDKMLACRSTAVSFNQGCLRPLRTTLKVLFILRGQLLGH